MKKDNSFVNIQNILEKNAHYNILIGERTNGKTFAILDYAIQQYFENGSELAYIRRWADDIKAENSASVFDDIIAHGLVSKYSHGRWNGVVYKSKRWYFTNTDESGNTTISSAPFAYAFALSLMEHGKGVPHPQIRIIFFEEFLTRKLYLNQEFILFTNVLSTIIRIRNDVKIFMAGNTVNIWSPYYSEMGLSNATTMKKGSIDVYTYGDSELKVAVWLTDSPKVEKKSNVYFAFNNPRLQMITGNGNIWEMDSYPHLPYRYTPKMIKLNYFIEFDGKLLECDVVQNGGDMFTYIHPKTTPLKYPDKDLIFSFTPSPSYNWRHNIMKPFDKVGKKIYNMFALKKVFYQDNEVGEIVRNYLNQCGQQGTRR